MIQFKSLFSILKNLNIKMKRLCAKFLNTNKRAQLLPQYPERILQFGSGNFLRGFADWLIDEMNKKDLFMGKIIVVQPTRHGKTKIINKQDGLYTLIARGPGKQGKPTENINIIQSISRGVDPYNNWNVFLECAKIPTLKTIISNTTEAGISYLKEPYPLKVCPESFPAKLTVFLHKKI